MVDDLRAGKLILSPYFQRNLVWRDVHKKDFIDTILLGLPFPQIFIAQGDIDVETLTSRSVIVDGQQRVNAIKEFVSGDLEVNGKTFNQLENKEEFLRYQVPVIDLELKASDPQIIDIFKRLNRTFYALSSIEKMSTEYATVDLMLIAKFACGLLRSIEDSDQEEEELVDLHPLMPEDFLPWASSFDMTNFQRWLLKTKIFTEFEIARVVHLMFTLNIISTVYSGFFPRNDKTREFLEDTQDRFPFRDEILSGLEMAAETFLKIDLPSDSVWYSKSNAFSLMVICFWHSDALRRKGVDTVKSALMDLADNLPDDYALAAREGVNNRKQRITRHEKLAEVLGVSTDERRLQ
ncbi:DUF262 domain-containing protein [Tropicimonas sp. IMCC34011]|uniref:DUF262 domain-containing protein n=1 Tax=Tropicimonas sp. IMCC34011 TaxID=2248759 RepID=UPI0013009888|nr:DUF262 domain-containing protein [Tropicimonas sp. IMCC34011]